MNARPLWEAAWKGNVQDVQRALQQQRHQQQAGDDSKSLVNQPFGHSLETPLHAACKYGRLNIVKILLQAGACPNQRDAFGATPLHAASASNTVRQHSIHNNTNNPKAIVRALLKAGADVDAARSDDQSTPLHAACKNGALAVVQKLLKSHATVDWKDASGCTPLMKASRWGEREVAGVLVQAGANLFARDAQNQTAFDHAVAKERQAVVDFLLEQYQRRVVELEGGRVHEILRQAVLVESLIEDTEDENEDGDVADETSSNESSEETEERIMLPIGTLSVYQYLCLLRSLIHTDGDGDDSSDNKKHSILLELDDHGEIPLHIACRNNAPIAVVGMLVTREARRVPDGKGDTALHLACRADTRSSSAETVGLLLHLDDGDAAASDVVESSDDIQLLLQQKNNQGDTPLHVACRRDVPDSNTIRMLVQACSDAVLVLDRHGDLPLHLACKGGNASTDTLRYLVENHPVTLCSHDANDDTALHIVCKHIGNLRFDLVEFLVEQDVTVLETADAEGALPIHVLCSREFVEHATIEFVLLRNIRSLLVSDDNGDLPLHIACRNEGLGVGIVFLLVGAGVGSDCVRVRNASGDLPLHVACRAGALIEIIRTLARQDLATLHIPNNEGALPIHIVCGTGAHLEKIQYLVEQGGVGTLVARDRCGRLPVHCACQVGASMHALQYLVEQSGGAQILRHRDGSGALPVHLLCACPQRVFLNAVKFVVVETTGEGETVLRARDGNGFMPLHLACQSGQPLDVVEYLALSYPGAELARTLSGDLPVLLSGRSSSLDVIYALLKRTPEVVPS